MIVYVHLSCNRFNFTYILDMVLNVSEKLMEQWNASYTKEEVKYLYFKIIYKTKYLDSHITKFIE